MLTSLAQVGPLYALEKEDGFRKSDQRGIDFTTARLARGTQFVRNMIYDAWLASAEAPIGYSPSGDARKVADVAVCECAHDAYDAFSG